MAIPIMTLTISSKLESAEPKLFHWEILRSLKDLYKERMTLLAREIDVESALL